MSVTTMSLTAVRLRLTAIATGLALWLPHGTLEATQPACRHDAVRAHLVAGPRAAGLGLLAAARQTVTGWTPIPLSPSAPARSTARAPGIQHESEDQQHGRLSAAALRDRVALYRVGPEIISEGSAVALNIANDQSCRTE